jgi:hypothetical protein
MSMPISRTSELSSKKFVQIILKHRFINASRRTCGFYQVIFKSTMNIPYTSSMLFLFTARAELRFRRGWLTPVSYQARLNGRHVTLLHVESSRRLWTPSQDISMWIHLRLRQCTHLGVWIKMVTLKFLSCLYFDSDIPGLCLELDS